MFCIIGLFGWGFCLVVVVVVEFCIVGVWVVWGWFGCWVVVLYVVCFSMGAVDIGVGVSVFSCCADVSVFSGVCFPVYS